MAAEREYDGPRDLAVYQQPQQSLVAQWTSDDLQALKDTVAKDCNTAQFKVFVAACGRLGLDPFARQIVPIVQGQGVGSRMTPQVTIDGFRLIAERTHKYRGQLGPFWCGPDGEWHEVWLSDTPPVACKVGVLRSDFAEPMWGVARTSAYKQDTSPTWKRMPDVMIAKVAESLALRKAFPQELSGVYTGEEMAQADNEFTAAAPVVSQPVPPASAFEPRAKQRIVVTREMVAKLANQLQVAPADRKKLMEKHGGDFAAVYHELTQWAAAAEAEAQAASPEVSFEIVEESPTADGNDLHGAFGPLVP